MSLLDDEDTLLNETKGSVYNSFIHEEIEWNQHEHQSLYDFREWVKINIYRLSDGEIDSIVGDLRCQIAELYHEITQLKNEIMDLKNIINKNM